MIPSCNVVNKKAMKALGIEPYLIDMTPRIHASDIVKIAEYIGEI